MAIEEINSVIGPGERVSSFGFWTRIMLIRGGYVPKAEAEDTISSMMESKQLVRSGYLDGSPAYRRVVRLP
jgi:hypothetical protein